MIFVSGPIAARAELPYSFTPLFIMLMDILVRT